MGNTYWAGRCRRKRIQQILQHSVAHEPGDLIAVGAADTATQPVPNGSISPSRSPSTGYLGGSRGLDFPLRGRACTCRVSSSFASLGAARDDNWSRGARRENRRAYTSVGTAQQKDDPDEAATSTKALHTKMSHFRRSAPILRKSPAPILHKSIGGAATFHAAAPLSTKPGIPGYALLFCAKTDKPDIGCRWGRATLPRPCVEPNEGGMPHRSVRLSNSQGIE